MDSTWTVSYTHLDVYKRQIKDGEKKIKDAEKDISKIEHAKWYIYDRSTLTEYTSYGENADRCV